MERETFTVNLTSTEVKPEDDYPKVTVFGVEILAKDGCWLESFATKAEVVAFFRGLQAGSQMTGGPFLRPFPEIPPGK